MAGKRRYGQGCPVAHALDLVGERWALLVVRELRLGPRRYVDLQAALPDIGPSMLSQRLRDLEAVGVLLRRRLPPPAASTVYELTDWGAELEPVFAALARWGVCSPVVPMAGDTSEDAVMLGLRAFFREQPDPQWTVSYDIHLDRERYRVEVVDGHLDSMTRGETDGPADATVHTDRATVQALLTGRQSLSAVTKAGRLTVSGDRTAARRLFAAVTAGPKP